MSSMLKRAFTYILHDDIFVFRLFNNALFKKILFHTGRLGAIAVRATNLKCCILLAFAEFAKPNLASKDIIIENG